MCIVERGRRPKQTRPLLWVKLVLMGMAGYALVWCQKQHCTRLWSLGVYYMEEKGVECTRLGMLRSTRRKETHLIRLTTKITDTNHAVLECGILLGYCTIHFHSCDNVLDVLVHQGAAHCSLNGLFFLFCFLCCLFCLYSPKAKTGLVTYLRNHRVRQKILNSWSWWKIEFWMGISFS